MKILHVWDTAGVASLLAREQRKLGHEVKVLMSKNLYNPFSITEFYGHETFVQKYKFAFVIYALKEIKKFKPDIIHIHALWKIIPCIRLLYPDSKIILHLHGTDARYKHNLRRTLWRKLAYSASDFIILATEDLIPFAPSRALYIPNPVDTEHFNNNDIQYRGFRKGTALIFKMSYTDVRGLEEKIKFKYPEIKELLIHDRTSNPIRYEILPMYMKQFEYYIDLKITPYDYAIPQLSRKNEPLYAMSKTGLEALSLGMKVINYKYELLDKLPDEHLPVNSNKKVMLVYDDLMYNVYNDWMWIDKNL